MANRRIRNFMHLIKNGIEFTIPTKEVYIVDEIREYNDYFGWTEEVKYKGFKDQKTAEKWLIENNFKYSENVKRWDRHDSIDDVEDSYREHRAYIKCRGYYNNEFCRSCLFIVDIHGRHEIDKSQYYI